MHEIPGSSAFEHLLARLDADRDTAANQYEELRFRITQILIWKGCAEGDADSLADIVLDRVGTKIAQGEQVESINAYAAAVCRFVILEHTRKHREITVDELPEPSIEPDTDEIDGPDLRIRCLRKCLAELVDENNRKLIVGYYDTADNEKAKIARKSLADMLNMSATALKVKACRLRARLEKCVTDCLKGETNLASHVTYNREESR